MAKPIFQRKKQNGYAAWGNGLDYLLKKYWNDLDKLVKDNYYGRHNAKLINFLFPKNLEALKESITEMKKLCKKGKGLNDWIKKAKAIQDFGKSVRSLNEKVILIDTIVQFLRETSLKKKSINKRERKRIVVKHKKELKGMVASPSTKKIIGRARIISDNKDFPKMKRGEILVTRETTADFLLIIKKSKAIITDLGGVLCHAAIIAREMNKPCLVNTKMATQILKNNDLIRMDMSRGIVKILKKS